MGLNKKIINKEKMKMEKSNVNVSIGGGLPGILFVVFLVLKLCGVITWPWIWVFAPLWISFGLFIIIFIITLAISAACLR